MRFRAKFVPFALFLGHGGSSIEYVGGGECVGGATFALIKKVEYCFVSEIILGWNIVWFTKRIHASHLHDVISRFKSTKIESLALCQCLAPELRMIGCLPVVVVVYIYRFDNFKVNQAAGLFTVH